MERGNYITSNHWSRYDDNLMNIKLEGDILTKLQKLWNTMNKAFSLTLNINKDLGDYNTL